MQIQRQQTRNLAITAMFVAIFLLQVLIPNIGYIRILPALPAITTVPLTVAVYSILMGPKASALFGLFWGITSLVRAYTQPADVVSLLLFRNALIAVLPRCAAGLVPGLITVAFKKSSAKWQKFGYLIAGASASLVNTGLVVILSSLIFMNQPTALASNLGNFAAGTPLILMLLIALGFNGTIEAIFTAVLTPLIVTPLSKLLAKIK